MSRVIYVMESVEEKGNEEGNRRRYCVTGANGYIGSYLVKLLLQSGASVHATLRNPSDNSVQRHLLPFWESSSGSNNNNRLHLFKADLQDPGSFDDAVNGCHGVFHVAASMQFHIPPSTGDNSVDHYVDTNIINPAIQGTLNLLRSCSKSSSSVKRLVFTSSISTLTGKNPDGSWKRVVDETCQASVNLTRSNRASGWVYALSKVLTEEAAFQYCKEKGIELVSVVTSTVAGPFLTTSPVAPSSIRVLMSPVTGDSSFFSILSAVSERMGSIALVHSQDVCSAHLFLMEHPSAQGRYLCCFGSCLLRELVHLLTQQQHYHVSSNALGSAVPCEFSSRKLRELGFQFQHDIPCIIRETIACCIDKGLLKLDNDDQNSEITTDAIAFLRSTRQAHS